VATPPKKEQRKTAVIVAFLLFVVNLTAALFSLQYARTWWQKAISWSLLVASIFVGSLYLQLCTSKGAF
jgi:Flp pilus assembly protein TadB